MGWGCYKHEWDAGSEHWTRYLKVLANQKLRERPHRSWGRDGQICPKCYVELEKENAALRARVAELSGDREAVTRKCRELEAEIASLRAYEAEEERE